VEFKPQKSRQTFFADFDNDDEEEETAAVEEEEPKEEEGYYTKGRGALGYNGEDSKKGSTRTGSGGTVSSGAASREPTVTPQERKERASVSSDSFVPTRSRAAYQQAEVKSPTTSSANSGGTAQKDFSKAKHISSDQYFGKEDAAQNAENRARLGKFEGKRSISSADYYDRDESSMGGGDDASDVARRVFSTATADLGNVKEFAADASKKITDMANNFFSEWSDRY